MHFDLINSNNTSSGALIGLSIFFKCAIKKNFKNPASYFFETEHLNFVQLSKYMPRLLVDISHLIERPDTTISTQVLLLLLLI